MIIKTEDSFFADEIDRGTFKNANSRYSKQKELLIQEKNELEEDKPEFQNFKRKCF